MRPVRLIAILPLLGLVGILGALLWSFSAPPPAGRLDAYAASRIRTTCHFQSQCIIRMGDLFAGQWDTFYEFGPGTSQTDVDRILRTAHVEKPDMRRLLVLMRDGKVVTSEAENSGADTPLDGEVEFGDEHHREEHVVQLDRNARLQVTPFPISDPSGHAGTFFVLSSLDQ